MLDWKLAASYPTFGGDSVYANARIYTASYKGVDVQMVEVKDWYSTGYVFTFEGSVDASGSEIRFTNEKDLMRAIDARTAIKQGGTCPEHDWDQQINSAIRCKFCGVFRQRSLHLQ